MHLNIDDRGGLVFMGAPPGMGSQFSNARHATRAHGIPVNALVMGHARYLWHCSDKPPLFESGPANRGNKSRWHTEGAGGMALRTRPLGLQQKKK